MSTTVLNRPHLAPRPATVADAPSFWQRVWTAIEKHGERRAAAELRRLAALNVATDPELASRLLAAARQTERA